MSQDALEEARRHREVLERLSGPDGPLQPNSRYATVNDPEHFSAGHPRPERAELHNDIIQDFFQDHPDAAKNREALVMAGPPGAGKSTVSDEVIASSGGQPEQWIPISADDFKTRLLERAASDGSLERMVPSEISSLEASGEKFFPYDYSDLVHSESVMLAQRATRQAVEEGYNVVIDGTLSSEDKASGLVQRLDEAGYTVSIASVDTTAGIATERANARYDQGYAAAVDAAPGTPESLGGRWLPPEAISGLYESPESESSRCTEVARKVHENNAEVTTLEEYRVSGTDAAPVKAESPLGASAENAGPAPPSATAPPPPNEEPPPAAAPADSPPEPVPH